MWDLILLLAVASPILIVMATFAIGAIWSLWTYLRGF